MSKIMRQLMEEGRAAREGKKGPAVESIGQRPECPHTPGPCSNTPVCSGICMKSWPNIRADDVPEGAWPYPLDET